MRHEVINRVFFHSVLTTTLSRSGRASNYTRPCVVLFHSNVPDDSPRNVFSCFVLVAIVISRLETAEESVFGGSVAHAAASLSPLPGRCITFEEHDL